MDMYGVYKILRCMSKIRLYTKLLRIHLFSVFTISIPRALVVLVTLGLLIVKTLLLLHFTLVTEISNDLPYMYTNSMDNQIL